MPYGVMTLGVVYWLTDMRQDELAEQRAAGEGMFDRRIENEATGARFR